MNQHQVGSRGEYAHKPTAIPKRGWKEVALRVYREMGGDNLSIVAAGVAFYAFLAAFPAIAALVMLYGLIADPAEVEQHLNLARDFMPPDGFAIIQEQTHKIASQTDGTLSLGLLLTLALSIWSATKGVKALMTALNIAYEEDEKRGFISLNAWALGFTLGAVIMVIVAFGIIAAIPALVALLPFPEWMANALLWLRWLAMALFAMIGLGILYRYAPSRQRASLRWVTPGAVVATIVWIVGSVGFSLYVQNFEDYNATFGSLGAVVALLMWLYVSAYIICLGAELNSELEHQTHYDTTTGPSRPLGQRGAYVADHVAGSS